MVMPVCEALVMSHNVEPSELAATAAPYGQTPFLLYSSTSGSARVNHVSAVVTEGEPKVLVSGFGRGVVSRVADGATLSLLWPAHDDGFSLIADGIGTLDEGETTLTLAITAAVLHRPAPVDGAARC